VVHDIPWSEDRNARLGAMGYALAAEEIVAQFPNVAWIVRASGGAGTEAGLLAGLLALGHPARVIADDVDAQAARVAADVRRVGREAAGLLDVAARWNDACVEVADAWCGPAYGVPDATTDEAIALAARLEGFALDPVYAGKGMAGLIGLARAGRFRSDEGVVWIHTGGAPGLFAYPDTMARAGELGAGI
jgi:L-cysteate sulfo-lyase